MPSSTRHSLRMLCAHSFVSGVVVPVPLRCEPGRFLRTSFFEFAFNGFPIQGMSGVVEPTLNLKQRGRLAWAAGVAHLEVGHRGGAVWRS